MPSEEAVEAAWTTGLSCLLPRDLQRRSRRERVCVRTGRRAHVRVSLYG